jgi:hypothetical protein
MTHTPDELRTLVDALHECLPTAEDGPDHRTYAMVLGSDLRKAHDILRQLADAKPVAWLLRPKIQRHPERPLVRGIYTSEPTNEQRNIADLDGDEYIILYAAPAAPANEQVPWRDHVEHRLRTWKQKHVNRSGDQLALDDFMGEQDLDDLIDFVCDEWAEPVSAAPAVPGVAT